MDKIDFKGALEELNDDEIVDTTYDYFTWVMEHEKTIQTALRIADRLQSGELHDVATEQHKLWEKYLGGVGDYYSNNGTAWLGCLNKAISQQLIKECGDV